MKPAGNITFILVETRTPGNIGAVSRALQVTGLKNLRLVNPPVPLPREEGWMAHGSAEILAGAQTFASTREAVADLHFLAGTTQRRRQREEKRLTPREASRRMHRVAASGRRVGILFGTETNGLSNQDLECCDIISTIPTAKKYPSLNLAQAAMIFAYELFLAGGAVLPPPIGSPQAPTKEEQYAVWPMMLAMLNGLQIRERNKMVRYLRPQVFRASRSELRFYHALYHNLRERGLYPGVGEK
jgi:TrmH family RNA methyltransferase